MPLASEEVEGEEAQGNNPAVTANKFRMAVHKDQQYSDRRLTGENSIVAATASMFQLEAWRTGSLVEVKRTVARFSFGSAEAESSWA